MELNKTDKAIKAFERRLKALIKQGIPPREAVEIAYREYPVMKALKDDLIPQIIGEMKRGGAEESVSVLKAAALKAWAPDALTLSRRTTKGKKQVINEVAGIIRKAIKEGKAVADAAEAMFDGYGYGQTLPTQDIPKFLEKLARLAPGKEYKDSGYAAALRNAKRHIEKLTTQGMKAAYNDVKRAIEQGNEKKLEKAIYVATQERTRYFAKRIARTELARAYTDGFMAKWADDDDCVAFKWKLSTGHPVCDICDMYAEADLYGMGPGIFPKDKVPLLPVHPNCMCHLRPVMAGSKLLKRQTPASQIEQGGREWLDKQTLLNRQRILGISGERLVKTKADWRGYARGYIPSFSRSRIEREQMQKLAEVVLDKPIAFSDDTGIRFIPTGTIVTPKKVIAGAGTDTRLRIAEKLAKEHGGNPEQWQKYVGVIKSAKYLFDMHWYAHGMGTYVFLKMKQRTERKK